MVDKPLKGYEVKKDKRKERVNEVLGKLSDRMSSIVSPVMFFFTTKYLTSLK